MAAPEKSLKWVLAGIILLLLSLGGGWFWVFQIAAQDREEIKSAQAAAAEHRKKKEKIEAEIEEYEQGGSREYYYRMLPDAEDHLLVETLRILGDIEEEAGVYILSGKLSSKKKPSGPALPPYVDTVMTLKIFADYLGLVRFMEGLEREVDRKSDEGGGRLFEVKGIKTLTTEDKGVETIPLRTGWKFFDVDVAFFTQGAKKT